MFSLAPRMRRLPRVVRSARLGPDWLRFVDSDLSNNARLADGTRDGRAAVALATRWTFFVEEAMRSYAGLAR